VLNVKILWNEIKQEIYKQMVQENFQVVSGQIFKENVIIIWNEIL